MSDRVSSDSHEREEEEKKSRWSRGGCGLFVKTVAGSFRIIFSSTNKRHFLLLFLLFALPLSLLLFSLSLTSIPIHSHILHLESLALRSHTHFESRQVWKESRGAALSLLHLKLLYLFPTYFLSLIASISSVVSADAAFHRRPFTLTSVSSSLLSTWTRPLLTSIFVYAILMLYSAVPAVLVAVIGVNTRWLSLAIWILGWGLEVYIATVLGMGLVVSILDSEKRLGLDAIWIGWDLMEGKGVCGMMLSGLLGLVTGLIWRRMERVAEKGGREVEKAALIGSYGFVVIWGCVVHAVFYSECKRRQPVREIDHDQEIGEHTALQVLS